MEAQQRASHFHLMDEQGDAENETPRSSTSFHLLVAACFGLLCFLVGVGTGLGVGYAIWQTELDTTSMSGG